MSYAIVQIQGKQQFVEVGTVLEVDRLPKAENKTISIPDVLLYVSDDTVLVGKPVLDSVEVTAEVETDLRGPKIRVATYKSKSKYRKVKGHRQELTRVKVVSIKAK